MDLTILTELIASLGFPIAVCVAMFWFIYQIFKKTTTASEAREEKLYSELAKSREINEKAIATITLYAEKLEDIQNDIDVIKTDITVITEKIS